MLTAACGGDGTAGSFTENPEPISLDLVAALGVDDDPETVPEAQRNFLEGCVKGFGDGLPDLDSVQQAGLLSVCGCSYAQLLGHSYMVASEQMADEDADDGEREELDARAYGVFEEIEDDLRSGDSELPDDVLDLIRTCVRSEAGL